MGVNKGGQRNSAPGDIVEAIEEKVGTIRRRVVCFEGKCECRCRPERKKRTEDFERGHAHKLHGTRWRSNP